MKIKRLFSIFLALAVTAAFWGCSADKTSGEDGAQQTAASGQQGRGEWQGGEMPQNGEMPQGGEAPQGGEMPQGGTASGSGEFSGQTEENEQPLSASQSQLVGKVVSIVGNEVELQLTESSGGSSRSGGFNDSSSSDDTGDSGSPGAQDASSAQSGSSGTEETETLLIPVGLQVSGINSQRSSGFSAIKTGMTLRVVLQKGDDGTEKVVRVSVTSSSERGGSVG